MANEIADSSSKVVDTIKNEIEKAASNDEVQKVIAAAQEKIGEVATEVEKDFKKVGDKLKDIIDELSENPSTLDELKQTIIDVIAGISPKIFEKIKNEVLNASSIDEIKEVITAAHQKIDDTATEMEGGLLHVADKLEEMLESIKNKN